MMERKWTQRIGIALAVCSLLSVLASQVALPQNTAGLVAMQNTAVSFTKVTVGSGGVVGGPTLTKCVNIDPTSSITNWIMWKAKAAITVTHIDCLTDVATSTVAATVQACDANGANCANVEAAITCATTNAAEASGIDTPAVTAGSWIRVTRGATANSPTQVNVCVTYTEP